MRNLIVGLCLFFFYSAGALAMDKTDSLTLSGVFSSPEEKGFKKVISSRIVGQLESPRDFFAFGQMCQAAYEMISHPDFYLSSDPQTLTQQLRSLILPNGEVLWADLQRRTNRTQHASDYLFMAGMRYPWASGKGYKITLDEAWKPHGLALYLASAAKHKEAKQVYFSLPFDNANLLDTVKDTAWQYFLPFPPQEYFNPNQIETCKLMSSIFVFGQAWHLVTLERYKRYVSNSPQGEACPLSGSLLKLTNILKFLKKQPEGKDGKIGEMWSIVHDAYLKITERHTQAMARLHEKGFEPLEEKALQDMLTYFSKQLSLIENNKVDKPGSP